MSSAKKKKLVIVESPVKARTIARFLGADYSVESCMGHIRDLPGSAKELPESVPKKTLGQTGCGCGKQLSSFLLYPVR